MLLVLTIFYLFFFGQLTNAFLFFFEILRYNATNQHFVEVANGFSLLAHLLERVSPTYLTSETVTAVVNVCARVRFSEYVKSVLLYMLVVLVCVTWSIDRIIQIHGCITWGVELILAIFFIFFVYV